MSPATNRNAKRQPRWAAMTTSTVPASIAAVAIANALAAAANARSFGGMVSTR